jgi:ribosome biogenesis protein YTM1
MDNIGDSGTLLSGALDRSILAWEYNHANNSHSILYECRGHTGAVESITLNANGDRFASGSADSMIKIWTTTAPTASDHIEDAKETRKKRKTAKDERILKVCRQ